MSTAIMNRNSPRRNQRKEPTDDRCITPAEARTRAARFVSNKVFDQAIVLDGAEARLNIYNWTPKDVWVVYKNHELTALKSSDIVIVCKLTGRVLYEGSARDEG